MMWLEFIDPIMASRTSVVREHHKNWSLREVDSNIIEAPSVFNSVEGIADNPVALFARDCFRSKTSR
jgi:hypothetical protein